MNLRAFLWAFLWLVLSEHTYLNCINTVIVWKLINCGSIGQRMNYPRVPLEITLIRILEDKVKHYSISSVPQQTCILKNSAFPDITWSSIKKMMTWQKTIKKMKNIIFLLTSKTEQLPSTIPVTKDIFLFLTIWKIWQNWKFSCIDSPWYEILEGSSGHIYPTSCLWRRNHPWRRQFDQEKFLIPCLPRFVGTRESMREHCDD